MKTRWNLPKSEQKAHSANAARLECAGLVIGVENVTSSDPPILQIEQSGDSFMYAGTLAGMALAVCVRMTVLKSGIVIQDREITIPGCSADIFFPDLAEGSPFYKVFEWLHLPKDSVLNHRIFCDDSLPIGRNLDGFLVAQSFDALPSQFQSSIIAQVHFADQVGNVFTSNTQLDVERCSQGTGRRREQPVQAGSRLSRLGSDSRSIAGQSGYGTSGQNGIGKNEVVEHPGSGKRPFLVRQNTKRIRQA